MTDTIILNASTLEYWEDVKRRTRIRNADAIVTRELERLRPSQIYEQYIMHQMDIIGRAAEATRLIDDEEAYTEFKAKWAEKLGLRPALARTYQRVFAGPKRPLRRAPNAPVFSLQMALSSLFISQLLLRQICSIWCFGVRQVF